ncbi:MULTISPECIES: aldo/keto reductase [unclassified Streptomyces]|uniref:aldo/keto reductase n=1 Tax=unclassified Streptomyces TaxID=2593676 RepID=UPI002DDA17EB|nr:MULTISPECIES: aldo/keto reductase [unclassified Streptomyces]WSF82854.1 aldo/keto reductase [Streptomyces sp. NBC_01744]WSC40886.1 aldo/keto reductase [Streptomyces sp. NBC_01763]WSC49007.1 aldo/keto reductase [Streptomyces sp. NBC_01762]WSC52006.1 aldo/keto reductase [Streptomyces sp. NBC_01761]WSD28672.1 aldo/keto reductase [Streptomyces sp. NBC_01751]
MSLDSYVTLGRSGLRVSPFTLGTMTFGEDHGWGSSPQESANILAAYLDRGGNSIDTANIYTNGHSEKIIGDYFAGRSALRDRVVIGTKFFGNLYENDPNGGGAGRKAIVQQLENSLRRLQTDYVDIYWLHNFDPSTPVEETLRALDDLISDGKVRYVGFSDVPAWATAEAATIARFRGWAPIIALQLEYSLLERTSEGELIPMAQALGMGVMPWGPLKSGFLSGKYSSTTSGPVDTTRTQLVGAPSEADYVVIDALNAVAAEVGASPAAVALAWVQGRPGITSTLVGARRIDQFEANLQALDMTLTEAQRGVLDDVSAPTLNFPADNNRTLAPMIQFGGATVDGRPSMVSPLLQASSARY